MRIRSDDGFIEITRGTFESPADVDVRAESCNFSASVTNIFPLDTSRFFAAASTMHVTRRGRLVLSGTEDFELVLEDRDAKGGFWAEVQMTLRSQGRQTHLFRCRLAVDAEYWSTVLQDLRTELAKPPASN